MKIDDVFKNANKEYKAVQEKSVRMDHTILPTDFSICPTPNRFEYMMSDIHRYELFSKECD